MDAELKNSLSTGTTILGIVCKDGIVMASDRRMSLGHGLIFGKDAQKTVILNDYLVFAGCGSATEVQKISKLLTAELKLKELKSKVRPSVKQSASLLSNIRVEGSAFILGGFDEDGASLFEVTGGYLKEVKDYTASVGSGMPYVLGLLERQYKEGLTVKEGIELAKESILSSTQRDPASGNGIDIFTITKDGIKKAFEKEISGELKK
ncbi:proteasome subunit beta [Candidatus Pacearchaeota archaeon CG10_big_fil_rev_8_21_14_0_10_31_9]|nr:MAG: proteasome subunit beta [Candidatus Pacearchaeota archaeon CG10_big_fil_rev_8_21_14_0_10_31_9]